MTNFVDKAVIAGTKRRDSDGALIADVRIARTGVQLYLGSEVDRNNDHGFRDAKIVRVYRPGDEVFSADTMKSAAHRPVTNDHPRGGVVDSKNWKKEAVGNTADEVSAEGIYLRVPLIVSDEATILQVEGGKREVSAGYSSVLDWTSGQTPSGESYDAVQREIRINHVAIVSRGRAGSAVRIGDAAVPFEDGEDEGDHTMDKPLKTVTVDGLSIETTDQGAQVIAKLQSQLADANSASAKVLTDHAAVLADKDKQLALKDAEIDKLKAQVLDAAGIDKLVAERATVVANAKLVHKDAKTDGLTLPEIRKGAVTLALGDAAVAGKSQEYIDARFDILVEDSGKNKSADSFRSTVRDGGAATVNDSGSEAGKAYQSMLADMASDSKHNAKAN